MREDRHGRLHRRVGDSRRHPPDGFRVRDRRRFRELVEESVAVLPAPATRALAGARLEVQDVPGADAAPVVDPAAVPLAEAQAVAGRVHRLVVYRRPAELRATDREDLVALLRDALLEAVADAVGADPDLWDEA